jgi:hypothetical protein
MTLTFEVSLCLIPQILYPHRTRLFLPPITPLSEVERKDKLGSAFLCGNVNRASPQVQPVSSKELVVCVAYFVGRIRPPLFSTRNLHSTQFFLLLKVSSLRRCTAFIGSHLSSAEITLPCRPSITTLMTAFHSSGSHVSWALIFFTSGLFWCIVLVSELCGVKRLNPG